MKLFTPLIFLTVLFCSCNSENNSAPERNDENNNETVTEPGEAIFDSSELGDPPHRVTSVPVPQELVFAGENIPLDRRDVREALEYELMLNTFRHSHTLFIIKNIERWRSLVTETLDEHGVPEDFIYLAVAESEFDNNARSFAGAVGMWQIMEGTAKDYGLKMNRDVDMRRDPIQSSEAAARYLKEAYQELDDWILAAASYNRGVNGIKDLLEEQQVDNFYDLHLNSETTRYVYRLLAFKLILENPETYGYFIPEEEKYKPYQFETITVTEDIDNLVEFAQKHNTTYKELRILNPWFNNSSTFKLNIGRNDTINLRVPKE